MFLSAIDEKGGHASARSSSAPMSSSTGLKSDALLGKETVMTARVASGAYLVVRWVFAKNLVVALVVVWFVCLLSLSKLKFFGVPEPSLMLFSLGFLAFWVQICSIGYLCDRLQQRRKQILSGIWRTSL
ncbi:hypothetical protein JHK87_010254 [Glycine soja]|nr:hypothetical protein JHK87_010254 [Glycine soja]